MNTTTAVPGHRGFISRHWEQIARSGHFVAVFLIALIGGGLLTIIAGGVGLVGLGATILALALRAPVELVAMGRIFTATAVFLFIFDLPFSALVIDGGGSQEEQEAMRLTLVLSIVCLVITGLAAYLIFTDSPWALMAAIMVPIINLVLFVWSLFRIFRT